MFATVHAAGSSLLGLFTSCTTFDSTAVLVKLNSTKVKIALDALEGRFASLEVEIEGHKT
eukprot:scaffold14989_cov113-Isochrysis_galbana.AAC.7